MNKHHAPQCGRNDLSVGTFLKTLHLPGGDPSPGEGIAAGLESDRPAHLLVFASNAEDLACVSSAAIARFPTATLTGCTTAGQIGETGYVDDETIVIALPERHFATATVPITDADLKDPQGLIDRLVQTRTRLAETHAERPNGFAFLLVDGLSLREDILAATIAPAMGPTPLFGGSSGDGTRFERTYLAEGGRISEATALLTFVVTDCDVNVFTLNHLQPADKKMVVTGADPERRIVKEINAEPAAREFARIVNKDPDQLDEFTFTSNPVVVQLGDTHHVRSIQRVNSAGELVFYAAIDEGMVLTIATAEDLAGHLEAELTRITEGRKDAEILACDCVLRRIEATQTQSRHTVSEVLSRHHVVGFSTYGEQIGPLHVNHTMTGVVLSRPDR